MKENTLRGPDSKGKAVKCYIYIYHLTGYRSMFPCTVQNRKYMKQKQ